MQRLYTLFLRHYFALTVVVAAVYCFSTYRAGHNKVFLGDGVGYYSYLPAVFIYHDAGFGFMDYFREHYQHVHEFVHTIGGHRVNHYFIGEAILLSPFFLAGHLAAVVSGSLTDGFSAPYQVAMLVAGLFWFFAGLWWLRKVLEHVTGHAAASMVAIQLLVWGTNLFYYFTAEFLYSHIYSFTCVNLLLYASVRYSREQRFRYVLMAAVAVGFIALIRATNLLVLFTLPFFAGPSWRTLLQSVKWKWWLAAICITGAMVLLQPLSWYIQSGKFFVDAYTSDYFEFGNPHIPEVLWSYCKGWWVYTPMAFLSLGGFWILFRMRTRGTGFLLFFFLLNTYLLCSWHNWDYGVTFGQRAFIDTYAVVALLLAVATRQFLAVKWKAGLWLLAGGVAAVLNQFQTWQYETHILAGKGMTKEMYWRVFLRSEPKYRFLTQTTFPAVCQNTTLCEPLHTDATGSMQITAGTSGTCCLHLSGTFKTSHPEPDALLTVSFYSGDTLLGKEQVYLLRFMKDAHAAVHVLEHYIPLRGQLRHSTHVVLQLTDDASEIRELVTSAECCR